MARPSRYTIAAADTVLERLCEGQTLREICRNDDKLPAESTVRHSGLENGPGAAHTPGMMMHNAPDAVPTWVWTLARSIGWMIIVGVILYYMIFGHS